MKWRNWTIGSMTLLFASVVLAQTPARPGDKVVATINGAHIYLSELEGVLKAAGPSPVPLPAAQRRQRQMEALRMMIEDKIMQQFLAVNTRPVPAEEIERKITEMRAGLKEQGKSLEEFCQDTSQSMDQLRANVSDHLRWNAFAAAKISDAHVEGYYKENKDFFDGVTVRASHIVMRLPANANDADKAKVHAKLTQIRQKLLSDPRADFGEMAKQYSQDPMAAKGGDLGWIPRKWFDEAFSKAAFSLPVGQVSDVVSTDFGMHLIKVTDRKPGRASDFAKIKEGVREFCAEEMRREIVNKMYQEAVRDGKLKIELP